MCGLVAVGWSSGAVGAVVVVGVCGWLWWSYGAVVVVVGADHDVGDVDEDELEDEEVVRGAEAWSQTAAQAYRCQAVEVS